MTRELLILEIANHAEKLAKLMREPEMGLASYHECVAEHAQFITDWWNGKFSNCTKEN